MGSSKMDSSTVYALFEELKQKIEELDKNATLNGQTDSNSYSDEIITNRGVESSGQPAAILTGTDKKPGTDFGIFN